MESASQNDKALTPVVQATTATPKSLPIFTAIAEILFDNVYNYFLKDNARIPEKYHKIADMANAAVFAWKVGSSIHTRIQEHKVAHEQEEEWHTLTFKHSDPFYTLVAKWLRAHKENVIEDSEQTKLAINLRPSLRPELDEEGDVINPFAGSALEECVAPSSQLTLKWKGYEIQFSNRALRAEATQQPSQEQQLLMLLTGANKNSVDDHVNSHGGLRTTSYSANPEASLAINTTDKAIVRELFEEIISFGRVEKRDEEEFIPSVFHYDHYDGWIEYTKVPRRDVILPEQLETELHRDMQQFLESKDWYEQVDVPHRRGYLFYGLPGTGKTSTIITFARRYKLNLYLINLNNMSAENFQRAVRWAGDNDKPGIIVFEDIDCVMSQRTIQSSLGNIKEEVEDVGSAAVVLQPATPKSSTITFSEFLNTIDGIGSAEGRIIAMTTNKDLCDFDEALIRPGRIDVKVHFTYATRDQIERAVARFIPEKENDAERKQLISEMCKVPITMCGVQEKLIQHTFQKRQKSIE